MNWWSASFLPYFKYKAVQEWSASFSDSLKTLIHAYNKGDILILTSAGNCDYEMQWLIFYQIIAVWKDLTG
jgi:hypothetical protein